jgi:hypothetical protein
MFCPPSLSGVGVVVQKSVVAIGVDLAPYPRLFCLGDIYPRCSISKLVPARKSSRS